MTAPLPSLPDELESRVLETLEAPTEERSARVDALCRENAEYETTIRQLVAAAESDPESGLPRQIGPYRILGVIGEGGMGTVYAAEQKEPVHRRVALKVVKAGMVSKAVLARFEAERQALAMMNHPNIARVYDASKTDTGQPYFVMEFVQGSPITHYCDKNRIKLERRLDLFQQACRAVQHAHHKGVIHRDLKPTNILVAMQDGEPVVKVIDFGLARATDFKLTDKTLFTEQGQILGTPEYMSPEQAEMTGSDIDTRADVYSLGVLLYELLTGQLPFSAQQLRQAGIFEVRRMIREETPQKPSTRLTTLGANAEAVSHLRDLDTTSLTRAIRGELDWITMKALEKDRGRRFQTAEELAVDIHRYLAGEPVSAGPPSFGYRFRKLVRRYRVQFAAALAIVVTLIAGLIASTLLWVEAEDEREKASIANQRYEELAASLGGFDQLKDVARLGQLRGQMEKLWPEIPENAVRMRAWLERMNKLQARLPDYRSRLREMRRGANGGRGQERVEFEDELEQLVHDSTLQMITELMDVAGNGGEIAKVEQAIEWAERLRRETIETERVAARWNSAIAAIRASTTYRGLQIEPQLGLIPIRENAETKLWEFAHPRSGGLPRARRNSPLEFADDTCLVFVLVPRAEVAIGAQKNDQKQPNYDSAALDNEGTPQSVILEPFFVSKYEMTQHQWRELSAGENPSGFPEFIPAYPVVKVSWEQCTRLLRRHGLALPTEAQWEYACRGGKPTPWWTGAARASLADTAPAINIADATAKARGAPFPGVEEWPDYDDGIAGMAHVDALRANPFGLYHVLGNVFEWCRDHYAPYGAAPFEDGEGARSVEPDAEGSRVNRGGSYDRSISYARASRRISAPATRAYLNLGLRPIRRIEKSK